MTMPSRLDDGMALFLDFDGVLSNLVDDPETARMPDHGEDVLLNLSRRLGGAVCLISGRSLQDLSRRAPGMIWRAGGHGMDIAAPGEAGTGDAATPAALIGALDPVLATFPAARAEPKGAVVAVHYRADPEIGPALGHALKVATAGLAGYGLHGGKMIWELKPEGRDKGIGLRRMMDRAPFAGRPPVMVGDDVTDEDGFRAALDLGGTAVKVGEGDTAAPHRLADVATVLGLAGPLTASDVPSVREA